MGKCDRSKSLRNSIRGTFSKSFTIKIETFYTLKVYFLVNIHKGLIVFLSHTEPIGFNKEPQRVFPLEIINMCFRDVSTFWIGSKSEVW